MVAAQSGHLEVLRLLLGRGAAVDAVGPDPGCTAFHTACGRNHPDCVEALVRAGCDVAIKDSSGLTGREVAERKGSKEVLQRLRSLARQPLVGVLVELAGLVGAAAHNGKRATVTIPHTAHLITRPSGLSVPHARASCLRSAPSRRTVCVPVEWRSS